MKPTDHIIDDVLHNLKRLDPTKKKLRSKDFCFHETTCGCSTSRATSTMTVLGSLMLQASSLTSRMPAHTDQPLPVVSHSTPWILCVITSKKHIVVFFYERRLVIPTSAMPRQECGYNKRHMNSSHDV